MTFFNASKLNASAIVLTIMIALTTSACGSLDEFSELANLDEKSGFTLHIVSGSGQKSSQNNNFAPVTFAAMENGVAVGGVLVEFKIVDATGQQSVSRESLATAWDKGSLADGPDTTPVQNPCGQLMNATAETDEAGMAQAQVRAGSNGCSNSALIGRAISADGQFAAFAYIMIQSH